MVKARARTALQAFSSEISDLPRFLPNDSLSPSRPFVPTAMREGALALGATRARAVFSVVMPAALPGIVTGVVLALARVAGETAPLLFTSFNNAYFTTKLTQPISSLTVQVFTYAISPYEDWHQQAWAAGLVLLALVLVTNIAARMILHREPAR